MKRLFALFLAFCLIFCLCACDAPQADPVKGTWFIDLSAEEFFAFYKAQMNELLGIGDLNNLSGDLPQVQEITILLVLDGYGSACAYIEKDRLQGFIYDFFNAILTEQRLYQLFGSEAQAKAAMGDLSMNDLIYLLQTQFSGTDFAQEFATVCGYSCTEEYLVIPFADGYTYENSRVTLLNGFLEYDETDLILTDNSTPESLGLNLENNPFIFRRISDQTEY